MCQHLGNSAEKLYLSKEQGQAAFMGMIQTLSGPERRVSTYSMEGVNGALVGSRTSTSALEIKKLPQGFLCQRDPNGPSVHSSSGSKVGYPEGARN